MPGMLPELWEAEIEGLFDAGNLRPTWETQIQLYKKNFLEKEVLFKIESRSHVLLSLPQLGNQSMFAEANHHVQEWNVPLAARY